MRIGVTSRPYLRETLLALLVVALTFLNYGHASVSASGSFQVASDSWCGDPLLPTSPDHSPCHACRIGSGADLPPPPACIEPVAFVATAVVYAAVDARHDDIVAWRTPLPRGPPSFA